MADISNRALEAFEAFMKTEAPSDYDASNGDAWYVWKACWAAALASRPAEVDDELLNAAQALVEVLDGYAEQLVPINRMSYTVRRLREVVSSNTTNKEK